MHHTILFALTTNTSLSSFNSSFPLHLGSLVTLGLSACYAWEYSCKDGTCIDLEQRCDLRVDCPDKSDEIGCDKLLLPEDYLSQLTPPGGLAGGPLGVNLSISLHGFSEVVGMRCF